MLACIQPFAITPLMQRFKCLTSSICNSFSLPVQRACRANSSLGFLFCRVSGYEIMQYAVYSFRPLPHQRPHDTKDGPELD